MTHPPDDPLPPDARRILDAYAAVLAEVRFPDVDLGILESAAAAVAGRAADVQRARAALEAATAALDEATSTLRRHCERAAAYARVYAASRPELHAALAPILDASPSGAPPELVSTGAKARRRARSRRRGAPGDAGADRAETAPTTGTNTLDGTPLALALDT
jgi:hypothetical protein